MREEKTIEVKQDWEIWHQSKKIRIRWETECDAALHICDWVKNYRSQAGLRNLTPENQRK